MCVQDIETEANRLLEAQRGNYNAVIILVSMTATYMSLASTDKRSQSTGTIFILLLVWTRPWYC